MRYKTYQFRELQGIEQMSRRALSLMQPFVHPRELNRHRLLIGKAPLGAFFASEIAAGNGRGSCGCGGGVSPVDVPNAESIQSLVS